MDATPSASGATPRVARALGHAGLIPFVAGAFAIWGLGAEVRVPAAVALAGYGALIVSFLGGIHWGLGFLRPDAVRFVWGVVPSLVAWPALLLPPAAGLALLAAMLVVCYVVDRRVYTTLGLQRWLPLRLQLSAVAAACCAAGAVGVGR